MASRTSHGVATRRCDKSTSAIEPPAAAAITMRANLRHAMATVLRPATTCSLWSVGRDTRPCLVALTAYPGRVQEYGLVLSDVVKSDLDDVVGVNETCLSMTDGAPTL